MTTAVCPMCQGWGRDTDLRESGYTECPECGRRLPDTTIKVGDRVRSFDFPDSPTGRTLEGPRAAYVEGEVVELRELEGCPRYIVRVERRVFGGKETTNRIGELVHPPVNGTPSWLGDVCDGVERL